MIPKRIEFEFSDDAQTIVSFSHSRTKWVSWSARVTTAADRLRKTGGGGAFFSNGFLQPTLIHAQRLLARVKAGEGVKRAEAVEV